MNIIAIDGPSGVGKSVISDILAKKLSYIYLDSGIIYRTIAYYMIKNNINETEEDKICEIIDNLNLEIDQEVKSNGENVTPYLRYKDVTLMAGLISNILSVRTKINELIYSIIGNKDAIVSGRDITTVVYPNANIKFYMTASALIRAKRRYYQNLSQNIECNLDEIVENIEKRDKIDLMREVGALKIANDAYVIDTTHKEIDDVVEEMYSIIKENL